MRRARLVGEEDRRRARRSVAGGRRPRRARGRTARSRTPARPRSVRVRAMFQRRVDPPSPADLRLPQHPVACPASSRFSPGWSRQNSSTSCAEEAHLRALVDGGQRGPATVDRPRAPAMAARPGARDVVDPASAVEDAARVEVVRLPQRPRVRREREAADRTWFRTTHGVTTSAAAADHEQRGAVSAWPKRVRRTRGRPRAGGEAARAARFRGSRGRARRR